MYKKTPLHSGGVFFMENERNVSPVSAHAFNNEKPPCESRVASLSKKQYFIFMLREAARIQSNLLCKFINSGSMYLGIYTREEKMCPQDAVFLRDSLESVVSSERLFGKRSFSTASGGQPSAFWLNPSYTLQRPRCRGCRRPNPARRWRRNSPR